MFCVVRLSKILSKSCQDASWWLYLLHVHMIKQKPCMVGQPPRYKLQKKSLPVMMPHQKRSSVFVSRISLSLNWIFLFQEFGGNFDKDTPRVHYLAHPFIARYVRFHPVSWSRDIALRAGVMGRPHQGDCVPGFTKPNAASPCGKFSFFLGIYSHWEAAGLWNKQAYD